MKTWASILANIGVAALGVLQATDWVHVVGGSGAGLAATSVAIANVVLHYFVGTRVPAAKAPAAKAG